MSAEHDSEHRRVQGRLLLLEQLVLSLFVQLAKDKGHEGGPEFVAMLARRMVEKSFDELLKLSQQPADGTLTEVERDEANAERLEDFVEVRIHLEAILRGDL